MYRIATRLSSSWLKNIQEELPLRFHRAQTSNLSLGLLALLMVDFANAIKVLLARPVHDVVGYLLARDFRLQGNGASLRECIVLVLHDGCEVVGAGPVEELSIGFVHVEVVHGIAAFLLVLGDVAAVH